MRRHAVLLTVLFALSVTVVSVSYIFWKFNTLNYKRYINNIFTKHSIITQLYHENQQYNNSLAMLEANLALYNVTIVQNQQMDNKVLQNAKILKDKGQRSVRNTFIVSGNKVFQENITSSMDIQMLQYKGIIYFYLKSDTDALLLRDSSLKPYYPWNLLTVYLSIITVIVVSFLLILQRLRPLRRLFNHIVLFGEGNLNVSFKVKGSDEIAVIANELETARIKINSILEARTLFLRNVMHELKTPIAKGTIATQMLDSSKQRDRFSSIFSRLEIIVNEFALIEEVTSITCKSDFSQYRLIDIIDGAIDLAMVERENVTVDVSSAVKIDANYKLYTVAIKNMIDNAMKYSPDQRIKILMFEEELAFESRGEKLKHPLRFYIEPFTKDAPSKDSFGLGLYLVDSILIAHNEELAYEYDEGINRFIFARTPQSS
jgi:two-component system, OmpR family, sensor kinase